MRTVEGWQVLCLVWGVWVCGIVGVVVLCKLDERGETRPRSDVM